MNKPIFEERQKYSIMMNKEIHDELKKICKRYQVAMSDCLEFYALQLIRDEFVNKPKIKETYVDYLVNGF